MPPAIVQVTPIFQGGSLPSGSCTFASPVTPGNLIAVAFGDNNAGGPPYAPSATVSDGTDTYSQLRNDGGNSDFGVQQYYQIWYSNNITASSAITVTANAGSGFINFWMFAWEVSGQDLTTPIETSGNVASATSSSLSVNITTTDANSMVCAINSNGFFATSWTPTSGTVLATTTTTNTIVGGFYYIASSSGTQSPGVTITGGPDTMILSAFAIKAAGGTAGGNICSILGGLAWN
jgi:hypothetical protein